MTDEERAYNYASTRKGSKFQTGEIAKYYNDGYQQAKRDIISKACEWIRDQKEMIGVSFETDFIERFRKTMKG